MRILRTCVVLTISLIAWPADASQSLANCEADVLMPLVAAPHVISGSADAAPVEDVALDEMLRGPRGRIVRWTQPPALVVLMSVMDYQRGTDAEYEATSERLTDAEAADLVVDLTQALALFTGGTYTRFASVTREIVTPGARATVVRPGHIVVGRYRGLRDRLATIGLGGRFERGGTIRGGSIMLDTEYDRTNSQRRLLRAHELGHALGYNHVDSRTSIMNPRIGSEPTDFDRRAALRAFQRASVEALPDPCGTREPRE